MIEELFAALEARMAPTGIPMYLGARYFTQRDQAPRIVVIPDSETFEAPDSALAVIGGYPAGAGPRTVGVRVVEFEQILWHTTFGAVELVLGQYLSALQAIAGTTQLVLSSGTWVRPEWETAGEAYRLRCGVRVPILQLRPWDDIVLEGITQVCMLLPADAWPVPHERELVPNARP